MMNTSIKQLIQQMVEPYIPRIVIGVVRSLVPIEIIVEDDIGILLHDVSLIIPSRVWEDMSEGDEVYMLSVARGKIHYVLDIV